MIGIFFSILLIGDSLSVETGKQLKNLNAGDVLTYSVVGSGLNSAKHFDWFSHIPKILEGVNPDIVVIMIGANDWPSEKYEQKVKDFLYLFAKQGKNVYWVGVPPMQDNELNERRKKINTILRKTVGKANYIDLDNVLGDRGLFTLKKGNVTIRTSDGVHLTSEGGKLISEEIMRRIE